MIHNKLHTESTANHGSLSLTGGLQVRSDSRNFESVRRISARMPVALRLLCRLNVEGRKHDCQGTLRLRRNVLNEASRSYQLNQDP